MASMMRFLIVWILVTAMAVLIDGRRLVPVSGSIRDSRNTNDTQESESVCSIVMEMDPWNQDNSTLTNSKPRVSLECPRPNQVISKIKFASFGTTSGKCGSFSYGYCRSPVALSLVKMSCLGSRTCIVEVSTDTFGDPCLGVRKTLAVEALCA